VIPLSWRIGGAVVLISSADGRERRGGLAVAGEQLRQAVG